MANEKRLIDANEIEDLFYKQVEWGATDLMDAFDDALQDAQTVDAVEVVHGYWIDSRSVDHIGRIIEHSIDCSVCDSVFKDDSREVVKHWKEQFKVCPFCGAKMDGGNEDA